MLLMLAILLLTPVLKNKAGVVKLTPAYNIFMPVYYFSTLVYNIFTPTYLIHTPAYKYKTSVVLHQHK